MQDKMKILLDQIKLPKESYSYYESATLQRIIGNKAKDQYHFLIELESTLPVEKYEQFLEYLPKGFPTIRKVDVRFTVKHILKQYIPEYFKKYISNYAKEHPLYETFLNGQPALTDGTLTIVVGCKAEKMQLEHIQSELIKYFEHAGFGEMLL